MNPSIEKLSGIASKSTRKIIGLMSGTSLDGLDIALCNIRHSGEETEVEVLNFKTFPYDEETRTQLKEITSVQQVSLEQVCILNAWLGDLHGELILKALNKWDQSAGDIDCIASHGQTIYHAPRNQHLREGKPNATLQIGDGDHIAHRTGIVTISDFRQKHTSAGGEGAPMAGLVDDLLFRDADENRILLNIGGIANLTWLPAGKNSGHPALTTDTGPGNTLIDAAVQKYFAKSYDRDGQIAETGNIDRKLLNALKDHPYFKLPWPKTTGPEVFNLAWVLETLSSEQIAIPEPEDLVTTLTRFSAETIGEAIHKLEDSKETVHIYVSGGGIHNPILMKWLKDHLPGYKINNFKKLSFDPDAKEAVLFAVLANETLAGKGFMMNRTEQVNQRVNFGKISLPE